MVIVCGLGGLDMSDPYGYNSEVGETAVKKYENTRNRYAIQVITGVAVALMLVASVFAIWYLRP